MMKTGFKVSLRDSTLNVSQFLRSENQTLRQIRTEQIGQSFKKPPVAHMRAMKDIQIRELFLHIFCKRSFSVLLISGAWFLQLVLDDSQAMAHILYELNVPTAFDAQLDFC